MKPPLQAGLATMLFCLIIGGILFTLIFDRTKGRGRFWESVGSESVSTGVLYGRFYFIGFAFVFALLFFIGKLKLLLLAIPFFAVLGVAGFFINRKGTFTGREARIAIIAIFLGVVFLFVLNRIW